MDVAKRRDKIRIAEEAIKLGEINENARDKSDRSLV